jgi:lipopolysaccharide/colanic/teichoic acid biosynthesis glycosyltransferase
LKYIFNIVVYSLFLLLFFSFVYLIVKSIIKFFASIFFKQMRKNLNGGDFVCYKFRSMKVNDVADSKQAMLMVLVKQNLGIYFFVLILINFPSSSMCLKVVC